MDPKTAAHVRREGSYTQGRHRGRHAIDFILVEPSHSGNVGSAARALQVMGFERLTVVNAAGEALHRHRDARALASGAFRVLEGCRLVASLDEALADCRLAIAVSAAGREFAPLPQSPRAIGADIGAWLTRFDEGVDEASTSAHAVPGPALAAAHATSAPDPEPPGLAARRRPAPIGLVFGTERVGLSIDQAQRCQRLCSIDADPQYTSLNLAQAVQIMAYELRLAMMGDAPVSPMLPATDEVPARLAQVEAMIAHLERMLIGIGFLDPQNPRRLMPRLRRLFARAGLSTREVDILRGICNEVEKVSVRPGAGTG